jgi:hypothetical protein
MPSVHESRPTSHHEAENLGETPVSVITVTEPRRGSNQDPEATPIVPTREMPLSAVPPVSPSPPSREGRGTVEIHIGTIEVQSSAPVPAQPVAASATMPSSPAFAAGFDAFAPLRRYAPWPR